MNHLKGYMTKDIGPAVLLGGIILLITFGMGILVLFILKWIGFIQTTSGNSSNVVAATVALVGTVFTATVTLVGLILKRSLDERNLAIKTEAEERLKVETSIKAFDLFKNASGSASHHEVAGALYALTSLNRVDFALELMQPMWPTNKVSTAVALWVVNSGLESEDPHTQRSAADLLEDNAAKLPDGLGYKNWPSSFFPDRWDTLSIFARQRLLFARMKSLLSKNLQYWKEEAINADIAFLYHGFQTDASPLVKSQCGAFLRKILEINYLREDTYKIFLPAKTLSMGGLREELRKSLLEDRSGGSDQAYELLQKLDEWMKASLPYSTA